MKKETLLTIIAALLILLFMYAAAIKLADYRQFRVQLGQSPLLTGFAPTVAWALPVAEIVIALLLATSRWRLAGFFASFSMMTMFCAYIIAITRFSEYVPCSCGGILEKMSWNQHLAFNLLFLTLALAGILLDKPPVKNPSSSIRHNLFFVATKIRASRKPV